jgi:flagellar biosynthesis GTPase FlhF
VNVYDSIIDAVQEFDAPTRGEVYTATIEYLRYQRMPDLDALTPIARALFLSNKPILDNQIAKAESGRRGGKARKASPRARRGPEDAEVTGEPQANAKQTRSETQADTRKNAKQTRSETQADTRKNAKQTRSETQAKGQANAKRNASEQEQEQEQEIEKPSADADGEKSAARFVPPTPAEVDAYIAQMGYHGFTGQQLVDHYEANGWMRGRTRIRDWRACVRTWANQRRSTARDGPAPAIDFSAYALPTEEAMP